MLSRKYQSVPIPEIQSSERLLEKWALFWRCGLRTALRNLVLLSDVPRATGTWSLDGWRCFLGGIWMPVLTLSNGWQPQPGGQIQPLSCFSTAPPHKLVFYISKKILKKNQREIFWSMLNFFEIQMSVSINKVLTERGQVHLVTFCLWLLYYCSGSAG